MTVARDALHLLLVDSANHEPVLGAGVSAGNQRGEVPPQTKKPRGFLWRTGGNPDSLPQQRWGVIAPEGPTGDRMLALIAPLVAARAEQQGAAVQTYRSPPQLDEAGGARWRKEKFERGDELNLNLPRYLLLLGDFDVLPLGLQQAFHSDAFVGRLAFRDENGYAAYVEKLLRWERAERAPLGRSMFYSVRDGTQPTAQGYEALVAPGIKLAQKNLPQGSVVELGGGVPSADDLLRAAAAGQPPTVMFSLSHGENAPRTQWKREEQLRRQGAMSFGKGGRIAAEDVGSRAFLPGGVWFMLACYGAGTPKTSVYLPWLEQLQQLGQFSGRIESVLDGLPPGGEPPFVAALPQAALANPSGPLAFFGHVDLAWTYAFSDLDDGGPLHRPARFVNLLRALAVGERVGVAFTELLRYLTAVQQELASLAAADAFRPFSSTASALSPEELARRSHLWMLRQDLAGYILLGDPAARLPVRPEMTLSAPEPTLAPPPTTLSARPAAPAVAPGLAASVFGFAPLSEGPARPELARIEEAIALIILGREDAGSAAARLKLKRSELEEMVTRYRRAGRLELERMG